MSEHLTPDDMQAALTPFIEPVVRRFREWSESDHSAAFVNVRDLRALLAEYDRLRENKLRLGSLYHDVEVQSERLVAALGALLAVWDDNGEFYTLGEQDHIVAFAREVLGGGQSG